MCIPVSMHANLSRVGLWCSECHEWERETEIWRCRERSLTITSSAITVKLTRHRQINFGHCQTAEIETSGHFRLRGDTFMAISQKCSEILRYHSACFKINRKRSNASSMGVESFISGATSESSVKSSVFAWLWFCILLYCKPVSYRTMNTASSGT